MKKFISDFILRGLVAFGFGPVVLAVLYLLLRQYAGVETLTVSQLSTGIFSLSTLAFLAGGMNAIYQIERLPLMAAILLHGLVLYVGYLATYLLNGWLTGSAIPILVFTAIFLVGYLVIWGIIYTVTKKNTAKLNAALKQKNS